MCSRPLSGLNRTAGAFMSPVGSCRASACVRAAPSVDENKFGGHRDCRLQTAINRALAGEDPVHASGGFPVSLFGLEPQSHVNAADHKYVFFQFDLTHCFPHQTAARCIDLTRLQRASKGSRQSTRRGGNNVIERCGAGFRDVRRNPVMGGDGAVDAEYDRLRLGR